MKKVICFIIGSLLLLSPLLLEASDVKKYQDESLGVTFDYPNILTIDEESSKAAPLSVVFNYGQPPFAVSILFKEVTDSNNLESFIENERKAQEIGGYRTQIEENKFTIDGKISAIEFIRASEIGTIYYFIFPSQKKNKLLAFWHVTSEIADSNKNAVKAYKMMRDSLKISNY